MRSLVVREAALNMYFKDGKSYQFVAKALGVPLDTVKLWCLRYKKGMEWIDQDGFILGVIREHAIT